MGIGLVFLIYLVALGVLLVPATALFGGVGYFVSRKCSKRVKRIVIVTAVAIPVLGCAYLVGCIIVMGIVGLGTGRDVGFGDGFDIPLHNNYHWSAIDTTESANVYDLRDRRATDGEGDTHIESDNREAFADVLEFQEEGDWLAGTYASHDSRFDNPRGRLVANHWFLFNTRTHQRVDADSETQLQAAAVGQGFQLHLQSSDAFYSSHRFKLVDVCAALLLLFLPVVGLYFLWALMKRLYAEDRLG